MIGGFGSETIALVLIGSLGDWLEYEIVRDGDSLYSEPEGGYSKVFVTSPDRVLDILVENDVPFEKEVGTTLIKRDDDRDRFLLSLVREGPDRFISKLVGIRTAEVVDYTIRDDGIIEVTYKYVPGI